MKKYKHIIDNSEEGLLILNADKRVDYFNKTFFKHFKHMILKGSQISSKLNIENQIIDKKYQKVMAKKK